MNIHTYFFNSLYVKKPCFQNHTVQYVYQFQITWTLSQRTVLELEGISLTLLTSVDRLVTARTCPDLGTLATGGRAV